MTDPVKSRWTVLIASTNRPKVLEETVESILKQHVNLVELVLSVPKPSDVTAELRTNTMVTILNSPPGLTTQLNFGLINLREASEFVAVFDDDVELASDYLSQAETFFLENPKAVAFDGEIVREEDISRSEAQSTLLKCVDRSGRSFPRNQFIGCNMMVRRKLFEDVKFDENLPLYSWMFDLCFNRACAERGDVFYVPDCKLVHLRHAEGRINDTLFGYFQIANPCYVYRQNLISFCECFWTFILRGILANLKRLATGNLTSGFFRIRGNLAALMDVLFGTKPSTPLQGLRFK
jgi:glycosyltransferase involved in cell wall biosynthesis